MGDEGIIDFFLGRDLASRLYRKVSNEDGKSAKNLLLEIRQQVVAPVEHGFQRLMSRKSRPSALPDDLEPVVEQFCSAADPKPANTTCRELDGERHTVEPATDVCDDGRFGIGQLRMIAAGQRALH